MRILKVHDLNSPVGRDRTLAEIWATMAWPNDERARQSYLAAAAALCKEHNQAPPFAVPLDNWLAEAGGLRTVIDAPGFEHQKWSIWQAMGPCLMAGFLLGMLYKLARYHPDTKGGASVNKAVFLAENNKQRGFPQDRRQIMAAWSQYKDASPLAFYLVCVMIDLQRVAFDKNKETETQVLMHWLHIRMRHDIEKMLSTARHYQDFGIKYTNRHGRRESLLNPNTIWRVPNELDLPPPRTYDSPLSSKYLARLNNYQAPHPA
jgi:hypothetical protein